MTATCGHLTANDNKCVRNPIRIRIQIQIGNPIQYMLGATSSSKPQEVSEVSRDEEEEKVVSDDMYGDDLEYARENSYNKV